MCHAFGRVGASPENFMHYTIPTRTGQSGSPIIKEKEGKKYIIGVHIGNFRGLGKNVALMLNTTKR